MSKEELNSDCIVSVVIPCLDEERTIGDCINKATRALDELGITGEVIVVDNGSTDKSSEIAKSLGARVVLETVQGYGSALKRGIKEAQGKYIIMADADSTYDFSKIGEFLRLLEQDADLVMGSRLAGKISSGAMPWLHRWVGTPFLTTVLNLFYKLSISDVNCGMRGFRKSSIEKLSLECNGMEFASEMLVRAGQKGLCVKEIAIDYHVSPVKRIPNLRTFSDGWRHLRLILISSPKHLLLLPGLIIFLLGLVLTITVFSTKVSFFHINLGLSTTVFACGCLLVGMQIMLFGVCAMVLYDTNPCQQDRLRTFLQRCFTLERGLFSGFLILCLGLTMGLVIIALIFSRADPPNTHVLLTKLATLAVFIVLIGIQIFFSSMYISVLDRKRTLQ